MSSALGFPDFQRITQWFGRPLDQADAFPLGAGAHVVGPLDVRTFASVVVCVKPTGGAVTVTVDQLVPGGPAALVVSSSFVVNDGNVVFEAFVLLAGEVRVTFQGSAGGETLAYAIVPANTNTNAEVAALTQLGFQHNDVVVATETAIDLEDGPAIGYAFVDDPANLRMKITPALRQNGAAAGSLYRWDGAAWTPTAGVIVDDAARTLTLGGDTNLYRSAANQLKTDDTLNVALVLNVLGGQIAGYNPAGSQFRFQWNRDFLGADVGALALYDSAGAEVLRLATQVAGAGKPGLKLGLSGSLDTDLYRSAAGLLATTGSLAVGVSLFAANGVFSNALEVPIVGANTNLVQAGKKVAIFDQSTSALAGYVQLYTA